MRKNIDQFFTDFQKIQPTERQILQWSLTMERMKWHRLSWIQIATGVAAGLLVGVLLSTYYNWPKDNLASLDDFSATYVQVTVKNL